MQLITTSPLWLILLCFAAGFLYSYLLYRYGNKTWKQKLLAALRFIVVSCLAFFLLSPVLIHYKNETQKPIIILAHDNSESLLNNNDSPFYKNEWQKQWRDIKAKLSNDYDVQYLTFGNKIQNIDSLKFNEKRTHFSQLFTYINSTYSKQNIGAVVIASDGNYNKGTNPTYQTINKIPFVYTIGIGDSTLRKDAMVKEANANAIAYLGNEFPIEINLSAYECEGKNTNLNVSIDGKSIHNQTITFNQKSYFQTINVFAKAEEAGTKHLVISLNPIDGEYTNRNNKKDLFIEVIDGREKILLTYSTIHPDIGAIKNAISSNANYEVISKSIEELKTSELNQYNVAILLGLPSFANNAKDLIANCKNNQIPIWCITNTSTNINQLNSISSSGRIDRNSNRTNQTQAITNSNFNTFTLDDNTQKTLTELPPLISPYGQYFFTDESSTLCFQRIGSVSTKYPLWCMNNENGYKSAYLFGEGFWRWRLQDFVLNNNHEATNELVSKTIQYLTTKEDKRKFRVYPNKEVLDEDEALKFIAELYNNNYELISDKDISLILTNQENKNYNYMFSPNGKTYSLNIGTMPAGNYSYKAQVNGSSEKITGKILIKPLQIENTDHQADFHLLRQISNKHNAQFYFPNQIEALINHIKNNTQITSTSYKEKQINDLIQLKWIFYLLLALLSIEWFSRKYQGGI